MTEKTIEPKSTEDELSGIESNKGQIEEAALDITESTEGATNEESTETEKPVTSSKKESDDQKNDSIKEMNATPDLDGEYSAILTENSDEKNASAESNTKKEEVEMAQEKTETEQTETVQETAENKINLDDSKPVENAESEIEVKEVKGAVQEEAKENGDSNPPTSIDAIKEESAGNQTTEEKDLQHESIENPEKEVDQVDETENSEKLNEEEEENDGTVLQEHLPPSIVIEEENLTEEDLEFPAPFSPKETLKRSKAHYKLRCYESRRRTAYGSKLTSSSLYWRSFRELVHLSLKETMRAERIVSAHAIATEDFAIHMKAIHNNTLDNQYRPVTNKNILKDMMKSKRKMRKDEQQKNFKLGDMEAVENMDEVAKSGKMLSSILESQSILSDRYEECAASLKDDVSVEVINLRQQLEKQINSMQSLGDAILECLEAAEKQVERTWGKFIPRRKKQLIVIVFCRSLLNFFL